jgi:glucose-1-phosphate thymidylyltransferase
MKGIILAGGSGTRLGPLTRATSKQLLPVYDKPMVYHPLTLLMLAGIREVLVISTPRDILPLRELLGDGSWLGMRIDYATQSAPNGIAEALIIGGPFIGSDAIGLVLGDNLFYGSGLGAQMRSAIATLDGAVLFGHRVHDPQRYGIAELTADGRLLDIEEKPVNPKSNVAVTGLYFYGNEALEVARQLRPSARGELEITDVNRHFARLGRARILQLGRGMTWLDMGTPDALLEATHFVATLQRRQGQYVASPEEVAWRMGFIHAEQLSNLAQTMGKSTYGAYLASLLDEEPSP